MDIFKFYVLFMINTRNSHIFQNVGLIELKKGKRLINSYSSFGIIRTDETKIKTTSIIITDTACMIMNIKSI